MKRRGPRFKKKRGAFISVKFLSVAALTFGGVLALISWNGSLRPSSEARLPLSELLGSTHVHDLAVDPNGKQLYLATHNGVFATSPDGTASRISDNRDDYMGFTPHSTDPSVFFASGHLPGGGNLGVVTSTNLGKSWQVLDKGIGGPVDFHQITTSRTDTKTIYGAFGDIQISRDGGRTWTVAGRVPEGLIHLAASARDVNTLYAGTQIGLFVSRDTGKSWQPAYNSNSPSTMVEVTREGQVYAFVIGVGLIRASEQDLKWSTLDDAFRSTYIAHVAFDPTDGGRLYAAAYTPTNHRVDLLTSADSGRNWSGLGTAIQSIAPTDIGRE